MRLVRQYRTDGRSLIVRGLLVALGVAGLYMLVNRVAYAVAESYWNSQDEQHDQEILRSAPPKPNASIDDLIVQKQSVLKQLRNEKLIRRTRSELAHLYEAKGRQSVADGKRSLADYSYQRAVEFAPTEPIYYEDLARLYFKTAEEQDDTDTKFELFNNAILDYEHAADREKDTRKQADVKQELAQCLDSFYKFEFGIPRYKANAAANLRKALQFATPGSALAAKIQRQLSGS
jgi:hypothetical protein